MSKYLGKNFYEPVRDVDGNAIMETINPTQEEIDEAVKKGHKKIIAKQRPVLIIDILKQVLRRDLTEYGQGGAVIAHDLHHNKKDEIYSLLIKLSSVKDNNEEVILDADESKLIIERANKALLAEGYGYIKKFVNEGSDQPLSVVSKGRGKNR